MKHFASAAIAAATLLLASEAFAATAPLACVAPEGLTTAPLCVGSPTDESRRGRGRGKDDGAGHTWNAGPEQLIQEARRGRGKDDPAGHVRHGRGKDDPIGHT